MQVLNMQDETMIFKIKIVDTKKPTVKLKKLVYYVNPNQPLYAKKNTVAEVNDASLTQIYFLKKENSEELAKKRKHMKR